MRSTLVGLVLLSMTAQARAQDGALRLAPDREVARFVRERIQQPLRAYCSECHGGGAAEGGFRIDTYEQILAGGEDYYVSIRPWQPDRSPLLTMIRWAGDADLNMPPDEQMPPEVIDDFARWIAMGAPWPVDPPATTPAAP